MQPSIFNREPRPYVMARLACPTCGLVRMALAPQAISALECPYCFQEVPAEQIGTGKTLRALPYFEMEGVVLPGRKPPQAGEFVRLIPGQLVVYCEETSILHLAAVANVYTNRANLSPAGIPAISFVLGGEETEPVPHVSAAPGCPPWWCTSAEVRGAMGTSIEKGKPGRKKK